MPHIKIGAYLHPVLWFQVNACAFREEAVENVCIPFLYVSRKERKIYSSTMLLVDLKLFHLSVWCVRNFKKERLAWLKLGLLYINSLPPTAKWLLPIPKSSGILEHSEKSELFVVTSCDLYYPLLTYSRSCAS